MDDKKDSPWIGRILAINPNYGEAYATAGYFFVINRRYGVSGAQPPEVMLEALGVGWNDAPG